MQTPIARSHCLLNECFTSFESFQSSRSPAKRPCLARRNLPSPKFGQHTNIHSRPDQQNIKASARTTYADELPAPYIVGPRLSEYDVAPQLCFLDSAHSSIADTPLDSIYLLQGGIELNFGASSLQEQSYSYERNMEYWSLRPVTVIQRALQIGELWLCNAGYNTCSSWPDVHFVFTQTAAELTDIPNDAFVSAWRHRLCKCTFGSNIDKQYSSLSR